MKGTVPMPVVEAIERKGHREKRPIQRDCGPNIKMIQYVKEISK